MAFNGSGTFLRLYNWVNDAAAKIKIRADRLDAEMDGMATGLSTCITKNGQTTITANLPMSGYKHTGVANGSARTEYAALGQLQDGLINWIDSGGSADAITATYSPSVTSLSDGQLFFVRAGYANATTTPTFSPNGLTARTIVKNGGAALVSGDIYGDGHELVLRYNLANTRYELLNPAIVGVVSLTGNNTLSGSNTFTGAVDFQGVTKVTGKQLQLSKGADIASASALPLLTDGNFFDVTGTTTITSIATSGKVGTEITLQFDAALTLTHHATDLILPTGANIETAAGDLAKFIEYASGDWVCVSYARASGVPLANTAFVTQATSQATTSGTSINFTSIPTGVKRLIISFVGVSTNGTSNLALTLNSETSGYLGTVERQTTNTNLSAAFTLTVGGVATGSLLHGQIILSLAQSSTNTWTAVSTLSRSDAGQLFSMSGSKALSAVLSSFQVNAAGDTFDAGFINYQYEL